MFLLISSVLALNSVLNFQDAKEGLLEFGTGIRRFTKELLLKSNSLVGESTWTQFTHSSYPGYGLRVQTNGKLCDPTVRQYSGYLDTADDKHYYFWFFESRDKPAEDPVIMWLNGGPGCSSFIGLLTELGPCNINKDGSGTDFNNFSWNSNANIFFLDQPVNVGLSYSDTQIVDTTVSAAENVQTFLQLFFDAFPKYSTQSFHITGESYAGHYIPAIAKSIQDHKHAIEMGNEEGLLINLKSLAIGNGITDSLVQYEYYADMAEDATYGPILSPEAIEKMRMGWPICSALIKTCYLLPTHHTCKPAAEYCENLTGSDFDKTKLNPYDLRKPPGDKSFDESEILMAKWINSPKVQKQLGVDRTFVGCNDKVGADFRKNGDIMMPIVAGIPSLLEDGIDILVYAGDADWTCNWIGNKAWAMNLPWHGHDGFNNQNDTEWISSVTGRPAGVYRQFENFAFLKVYNSSHFVPADQPEHSLEFINKWIRGKSIISQ